MVEWLGGADKPKPRPAGVKDSSFSAFYFKESASNPSVISASVPNTIQ